MGSDRRRKKKHSFGRAISRRFFGSSKESFGKKKKNDSRMREIVILGAVLLAGLSLVFWLSRQQELDLGGDSGEKLYQTEAFDPDKDYAAVLEKGSASQLRSLLTTLRSRNLGNEHLPIQLENDSKIIETANKLVAHPDCDADSRAFALKTKLDATWHRVYLSLKGDFKDPFVIEQFFATADELSKDKDETVAKRADLLKARGIVMQTTQRKALGSESAVQEVLMVLLKKYPDDPAAIETIKKMFVAFRAFDSEAAVRLAGNLSPVADLSSSDEARELSRFMKDIIALYDSGIGNAKTIATIVVDDDNFMQRLLKLNADPDTGPTVVVQLENAIEFFEREGKFEKAASLSREILKNAQQRTVAKSKEMAIDIAQRALVRTTLTGQQWDYSNVDTNGKTISSERYQDRVVMVVFYKVGVADNSKLFGSVSNLGKYFYGKTVDILMVGVDSESDLGQQSVGTPPEQFVSIIEKQNPPGPYLSQCPTHRFPYAMLIDKQGNVDSVNITLSTVITRIEFLLSQ
jgi:hypothetical protein